MNKYFVRNLSNKTKRAEQMKRSGGTEAVYGKIFIQNHVSLQKKQINCYIFKTTKILNFFSNVGANVLTYHDKLQLMLLCHAQLSNQ